MGVRWKKCGGSNNEMEDFPLYLWGGEEGGFVADIGRSGGGGDKLVMTPHLRRLILKTIKVPPIS
jgi:hypothetical protein